MMAACPCLSPVSWVVMQYQTIPNLGDFLGRFVSCWHYPSNVGLHRQRVRGLPAGIRGGAAQHMLPERHGEWGEPDTIPLA